MENRRQRPIDLLSVGELLIDLISAEYAETLEEASAFERVQGGSPANLCLNMARLGNRVRLVAGIGKDAMGHFLLHNLQRLGVPADGVRETDEPTTLILVTRSREVSGFEAYRGADRLIVPEQLPDELLQQCSLFHTTCFALSRPPAQQSILDAAERAVRLGCQLSIDANYAAKIWPDRQQAIELVGRYCTKGVLVKISEVDWERLYGAPLSEPERALDHFLELGAREVCVTLGGDGSWVGSESGKHFLPARPVEVVDTTGAGDAFWSGYLTAWLDGREPADCALAGRRMAEIKLAHLGPLPGAVDPGSLLKD